MFQRVKQLETAIHACIAEHNANPKTFVWTEKAEDILEKVRRARVALNKVPSEWDTTLTHPGLFQIPETILRLFLGRCEDHLAQVFPQIKSLAEVLHDLFGDQPCQSSSRRPLVRERGGAFDAVRFCSGAMK